MSLDAPIGADDSDSVSEVVADPNAPAPFDRLVRESDHNLVREVFVTLSPRESAILAMLFWLDDGTPRTLEEVGEHFGVTRERIRQIQDEALKKMRLKMDEKDHPAEEESPSPVVAA